MGWSVPPTKFAKEVTEEHTKVLRLTALGVNRSLVMATPVDTGRARSNWWPSIGTPSNNRGGVIHNPIDRSKRMWSKGRMPPFAVLFLTNNLDYIQELNDGSSQQAPANFVERAVAGSANVL